MKRDIISMLDMREDVFDILALSQQLKQNKFSHLNALPGRTLAMIFEKSSTRTRVSFEAGMTQLGGHALYLSPKELQMGRGETIGDTARVLSRYCDCIMYRAYRHDMMVDLAKNATVPVINALDDQEHPCQVMADLLTIKEHKGIFHGLKCAYVGDGNNVCNSLMLGAAMVGMDFIAGCPKGYQPEAEITSKAKNIARNEDCSVEVTSSPIEAAENADILYTDVWVSMGQEDESAKREEILKPYQINSALVARAKKDCMVMHCLPAHRELEITSEVIDGKQSVVFDQAENRMHVQKAILLRVINH